LKRIRLKPAGMIGISIQPKNIHLIQLKKAKNSYLLLRARHVAMPNNVFVEGKIQEFATLATVLRELVHAEELQGCQAAVCVPANQVKMQRMVMPVGLTEREVAQEIAAEVNRGLPQKKETLAIDFERRAVSGALDASVFYAAARGDYVARYAACLRDAGLVQAIVDVDIFALLRAAEHALKHSLNNSEKLAAFYFGEDYAVMAAQHESEIIFYQQWGGHGHSAQTMSAMEWVNWCCHTYAETGINSVAIGGKQACVSSAVNLISAHWKCKVYETDPFAEMSGAMIFEKGAASCEHSAFLLAFGLAMRETLPWLR